MRLLAALPFGLASVVAAAAPTQVMLDVDGDGESEGVRVDDHGSLTVLESSGQIRGLVRSPAGFTVEKPELRGLAIGGLRYLHLQAAIPGAPQRLEVVAQDDHRRLREVYSGLTGPRSRDGDWGERLRVDERGVVRYQTAAGVRRCDGYELLYAELYDPAQGRFRPVAEPIPDGEPLVARPIAAAEVTAPHLRLFRFAAASTSRDDGRRADRLAAPRELDDGRGDSVWSENLGGFGLGAFVTARSELPREALVEIRLLQPEGRRWNHLSEVALLIDRKWYRVELPESGAASIELPKATVAECVSLVLTEAEPGDRGASGIAEIALLTARDRSGGLPSLVEDLVAGRAPADAAVRLLGAQGARTVAAIRDRPRPPDPEARRRLLRAAVATARVEALPLLIEGLLGDDPEARALAAASLGEAPFRDLAGEAILASARDHRADASTRRRAIEQLGPFTPRLNLAGLIEGADDDPATREALLRLADRVPAEQLLAPTIARLEARGDVDPLATILLGRLGGRLYAAGNDKLFDGAAQALAEAWTRAPGDFAINCRRLRAAAQIPSPRLFPFVVAAAQGDDEASRRLATEAAAAFRDAAADELLLGLLRDRDPEVRRGALVALGQRRTVGFPEAVTRLLAGEGWTMVRKAAVESLALGCGGSAGETLARVAGTAGEREEVRRAALISLLRCDRARATALLPRLLVDEGTPRGLREQAGSLVAIHGLREAASALAQALDLALERVLTDERDAFLAAALSRSLGELADPRGEEALIRALAAPPPPVRAAAATALGRLGTKAAAAALGAAAAEDPDPMVRAAAIRARGR